ncbi:MAG: ADP-ribosylglycohydrolase family protein [bacterium]
MHVTDPTYPERVYAGVLGKIIGVYLGRPFEGWTNERIEAELGEIWYYVHDRLAKPLIVADDDITGTFTFIRALDDTEPTGAEPTSRDIGDTWLNSIIELRSILWWGGIGMSTEHTAYHRLAHGVKAPDSGSIETNGRVVAEQIGAQIFIDGWGLVRPSDPEGAARLAAEAGRVSHDGEAVHAAQVVAALVSAAFDCSGASCDDGVSGPSMDAMLDTALGLIPSDSTIVRLASDLRERHAKDDDWRAGLALLKERYGYDRYPGNCHVVPNHGVVLLSLIWAPNDFQRALMIANTAGWDTDCNSGNVGAIMGVRLGLPGINAGPDFRGPVADRLVLPTADGGRATSDALTEAYAMVNRARRLVGENLLAPKDGARFHFSLEGSVQGFRPRSGVGLCDDVTVENTAIGGSGDRMLLVRFGGLAPGQDVEADADVAPAARFYEGGGYGMTASPIVYPGQTLRARVLAPESQWGEVDVRLVARSEGPARLGAAGEDAVRLDSLERGPTVTLSPGTAAELELTLAGSAGLPFSLAGVRVSRSAGSRVASGSVLVDWIRVEGSPRFELAFEQQPGGRGAGVAPAPTALWSRFWTNAMDRFSFRPRELFAAQDHGEGQLLVGTREWHDYIVRATLVPHLFERGGLVVCNRGLRRYLALELLPDGTVELVQQWDDEREVLARERCGLVWEAPMEVTLGTDGEKLRATVGPGNGGAGASAATVQAAAAHVAPVEIEASPSEPRLLAGGSAGLVVRAGSMSLRRFGVAPA